MVPSLLLRRIEYLDLLIFWTRKRLQKIPIVDWLSKRIIYLKSSWAVSLLLEICFNSYAILAANSVSSCANWKLCLLTLLSACWKWESSSVSESDMSELLFLVMLAECLHSESFYLWYWFPSRVSSRSYWRTLWFLIFSRRLCSIYHTFFWKLKQSLSLQYSLSKGCLLLLLFFFHLRFLLPPPPLWKNMFLWMQVV